MTGKEAYEDDVKRDPIYQDGNRRLAWEQLTELARWSWDRNPTARTTNHKPLPLHSHWHLKTI